MWKFSYFHKKKAMGLSPALAIGPILFSVFCCLHLYSWCVSVSPLGHCQWMFASFNPLVSAHVKFVCRKNKVSECACEPKMPDSVHVRSRGLCHWKEWLMAVHVRPTGPGEHAWEKPRLISVHVKLRGQWVCMWNTGAQKVLMGESGVNNESTHELDRSGMSAITH